MTSSCADHSIVSHTEHELPQRKVMFDFSNTPLHWLPDDPFTSHFISEIHVILPAGEFWFCRIYNQALPQVQDEKMREAVQGFIRQEAVHGRSHQLAIPGFLEAHGIKTERYLKRIDWVFDKMLSNTPFGIRLPGFLVQFWLLFRLGIIASIEHFTCILGKYVIEHSYFDRGDAVMVDMLRWHGAEEIEHRCVAFDLYEHLGGRYVMRYVMFALIAPVLLYLWMTGAAYLMSQDPVLRDKNPSFWRPWFWLEWRRMARLGHLPSLWWLLKETLRYLKPSYHPINEASTAEALAYLHTSPAVIAAARRAGTA